MTSGTQIPAVSQQLGEVTPSITVSIAGIVIIFPSATPIPELVHFIRLIKEQVQ
jgi:hypothetical protein